MASELHFHSITAPKSSVLRIEENGTSTRRVTALVLSILAALVGFFILPVEGALLVSAAATAMAFLVCCCSCIRPGYWSTRILQRRPVVVETPVRIYRNVPPVHVRAVPVLPGRRIVPEEGHVLPGRRIVPEEGHRRAAAAVPIAPRIATRAPVQHPLPVALNRGPHVPVDHGHFL